MFLTPKTKTFFADCTEHTVLLARTSGAVPPFVVEEVRECAADDTAALADALKVLQPKRAGNFTQAVCGIYPARRVVRRVTLELKRVKEAGYLNEVAAQQLRIEPDLHTLMLLNANDGKEYDLTQATQKEAIVCGLPAEDIIAAQDTLLAAALYPDRLEIGSLATLGALADYLNFSRNKTPTLVLEISADSTQSFIVSGQGLEASRAITQGFAGMIPVVQKELNLKDEDSARKLFYSNAFDFTGLAPLLIKKLLKDLQSSIGFYEVQTGQSIGQVICPLLPPKLAWLEQAIASQLAVPVLKPDLPAWLQSRQITLAAPVASVQDTRHLGLFALMAHYTNPVATHAAAPEKAP
jgi:hypothetical protein